MHCPLVANRKTWWSINLKHWQFSTKAVVSNFSDVPTYLPRIASQPYKFDVKSSLTFVLVNWPYEDQICFKNVWLISGWKYIVTLSVQLCVSHKNRLHACIDTTEIRYSIWPALESACKHMLSLTRWRTQRQFHLSFFNTFFAALSLFLLSFFHRTQVSH